MQISEQKEVKFKKDLLAFIRREFIFEGKPDLIKEREFELVDSLFFLCKKHKINE